uniref:hypothetical protein n=1 Tax=Scytothamnus australis TaxID=66621 RepID=UPI002E7982C4|nr:hypothetical protein V2495_pgp007 [Scytothamnus australis]WAM64802.1 hypothetical protein [Scytothamnus australis]
MSHYTSIKTKYTNPGILKKVINKLGCAYVEHKANEVIEVPMNQTKNLKDTIYNSYSQNYLSFKSNENNYNIIVDSQSWTQRERINLFLKKLELNYGYSETIHQALNLGFIRSKVLTTKNKNNRFIFQRYVEIKR